MSYKKLVAKFVVICTVIILLPQYSLSLENIWNIYQWGKKDVNNYNIHIEETDGDFVYIIDSYTEDSFPGVYKKQKYDKGLYRFSFLAKSDKDSTLLGVHNGYTECYYFADKTWQLFTIDFYVPGSIDIKYELNVKIKVKGKIWLKELKIEKVSLPDRTFLSKSNRSKCLFFSSINLDYLLDNIEDWTDKFSGFLFAYIMRNWSDNISKKKNERLFKLLKKVNKECKRRGVNDNYIKVAFYTELPELSDIKGWERFLYNFAECAKFARQTECKGIAIDTEYINNQYALFYSPLELEQIESYGEKLAKVMNKNFPNISIIILPNGFWGYGEYWQRFLAGIIAGMEESKNTSGIILFEEKTYDIYNIDIIDNIRNSTYMDLKNLLSAKDFVYWKKFCNFAPGLWPLGYYRAIFKGNKIIGYTGKYTSFRDKLVGSYADKSERYPVEIFLEILSEIIGDNYKYYWIYAHGSAWWQLTDKEINMYNNSIHKLWNPESQVLETDKNLKEFIEVLKKYEKN